MSTKLIATLIMVCTASSLVLSACKKTDAPGARTASQSADQIQQREALQQGFAESKKVTALRVNGESVSEFLVLREMNAIASQYLKPGQPRTPDIDARIRRDALEIVIFQTLAVQEARRRGMQVRPDAIDAELRKLRSDAGSDAAYQEYLGKDGLSEAELRKIVEQDALFEMIADREIDAKIIIAEADLRKRYDAERARFTDAAHRQITFADAKGLLEQKIRAERSGKRIKEWEQELRKNARIEVLQPRQQRG